jgi:flagellin
MGLSIKNNISSLGVWRNTDLRLVLMLDSMEKLSSGMRINFAHDDPAGLVISVQMRARIASLNQEIENTSIAVSKYQTAGSAMGQLRSILTEIRSLAVGAANGAVNDEGMLEAYQSEADNLVQSYNRIISETSFGKQKLLDGSAGSATHVQSLDAIDFSTTAGIQDSITALDTAASGLDQAIADSGSKQKYDLESQLVNLRVEAQNLTAAESQITDTDYILEYSHFLRNQLLLRSAMSLLAHSNIEARTVLNLLSDR